jgi:hypothetical protein
VTVEGSFLAGLRGCDGLYVLRGAFKREKLDAGGAVRRVRVPHSGGSARVSAQWHQVSGLPLPLSARYAGRQLRPITQIGSLKLIRNVRASKTDFRREHKKSRRTVMAVCL